MDINKNDVESRVHAAYQVSLQVAGSLPEDMENALAEWRQELRLSLRRQNSGGPAIDWQRCLDEFNEIARSECMPEF